MLIYLVTAEVSRARDLKALPGWKVYLELDVAIDELNEWWLHKARSRNTYGSDPLYKGKRAPSIFLVDVACNETLAPGAWPPGRRDHALIRAVTGWRRLDQDDYLAWSIEQKMAGNKPPVMESAWIGTIVRPRGTMVPCPPNRKGSTSRRG